MGRELNWIVKTWNGADWQEAARFATFNEAVEWTDSKYGGFTGFCIENALEKEREAREAKRDEFGTGDVIYRTADDYPAELDHYGRHWHRTEYAYTTLGTEMTNYRYETFDTDRNIRLYIDAAGHIWNEEELGIL